MKTSIKNTLIGMATIVVLTLYFCACEPSIDLSGMFSNNNNNICTNYTFTTGFTVGAESIEENKTEPYSVQIITLNCNRDPIAYPLSGYIDISIDGQYGIHYTTNTGSNNFRLDFEVGEMSSKFNISPIDNEIEDGDKILVVKIEALRFTTNSEIHSGRLRQYKKVLYIRDDES